MNVFGLSFSVFAPDGPWGFAAMVVSVFVIVSALVLLPVTQTIETHAQISTKTKKSDIFNYCWPATIFGCDAEDDYIEDPPAAKPAEKSTPTQSPATPLRNPVAVATAARQSDAEAKLGKAPVKRRKLRQRPAGRMRAGAGRPAKTLRRTALPQVGPGQFAAMCQTVAKRQYLGASGEVCTETVYSCGHGVPKKTSKFCS